MSSSVRVLNIFATGRLRRFAAAAGVVAAGLVSIAMSDEFVSGIKWHEPAVIQVGAVGAPPSDAILLFDGKDLSGWDGYENWNVADGIASSQGKGGLTTKQGFGDCQLHIEFATPSEVSGDGQGRGNSGVYFMGKYEVQILDSFNNKTYFDGQCASIYKQYPPLVNACRGPGEWQTYDIVFNAPRFAADGSVTKPAILTVFQNGVVVQNHSELIGGTFYDQPPHYEPHGDRLPIHIQDHGNPVRFRNIWLRELTPAQRD